LVLVGVGVGVGVGGGVGAGGTAFAGRAAFGGLAFGVGVGFGAAVFVGAVDFVGGLGACVAVLVGGAAGPLVGTTLDGAAGSAAALIGLPVGVASPFGMWEGRACPCPLVEWGVEPRGLAATVAVALGTGAAVVLGVGA
jgi:hypothetical protein